MKQGWAYKKLGDLSKNKDAIVSGPFGSNLKVSDYKDSGVPILRLQNVGKGFFINKDIKFVSIEKAEELKYHSFKSGDLVLAKLGVPIGKTCIVPNSFTHGIIVADVVRIRLDKHIVNYNFLEYFLNTDGVVAQLTGNITGATRPRVNLSDVRNIVIGLPPLPEQQRIVSILDEAFAAIAKAKTNSEQNLKNAKELFESYLNSIKAKKVDLGSLVDIKTGKLNSNAAVVNGEYPFFTCSREVFAIDKYAFDLEAILLAGNNASGDFNVKHYKGKFNAYQRTYVITVNEKQKILYRYLYYQLLKSLKEFKEMSVGANTRFLKLGMIQGLKIALPSIEEQRTIVRLLDELRTKTQKLEAVYQKKMDGLEELKKSILQRAFSGEL
ncbi:restriction endonuclease subunit S [Belliella pelovolcani]|uniref:Type I restriction enzyme, S subunit n=1 Tax=Belliella pelovolcani TaxID=529505 RepID=A0A1N7Q3G3_9BACT|nr:restriction endonuclease subunit S [Belliella pelovolcani]SIT17147.1 type I restriction enzyme, S subunit [Belliella pelovolcani]